MFRRITPVCFALFCALFLHACKKNIWETPGSNGKACRIARVDVSSVATGSNYNLFTRQYNSDGSLNTTTLSPGYPLGGAPFTLSLDYAPGHVYALLASGDTLLNIKINSTGKITGYDVKNDHYGQYAISQNTVSYHPNGAIKAIYRSNNIYPGGADTVFFQTDPYKNILNFRNGSLQPGDAANTGVNFEYDYTKPVNGGHYIAYLAFPALDDVKVLHYLGLLPGGVPSHAIKSYALMSNNGYSIASQTITGYTIDHKKQLTGYSTSAGPNGQTFLCDQPSKGGAY